MFVKRWGSEYFDKGSNAQFLRVSSTDWIETDTPSEDSSPYLLAVWQTEGTG